MVANVNRDVKIIFLLDKVVIRKKKRGKTKNKQKRVEPEYFPECSV